VKPIPVPLVLLGLWLAFNGGKATGGFHFFGAKNSGKPKGTPEPIPAPVPQEGLIPVATSTAAPFVSNAPAGLVWPRDWKAKSPVTSADVARAWALNSNDALPIGRVKYEAGPSGWLAYYRYKDPKTKKINVSVYVPRKAPSASVVNT
jgi:hypothetical protein